MNSRTKGKTGERAVATLLRNRDWIIDRTRCGVKTDDMIATDPTGKVWSVEVKRCRIVNMTKFKQQAKEQATARRLPWMLVVHVHGTRSHLVLRQGERAALWHEEGT